MSPNVAFRPASPRATYTFDANERRYLIEALSAWLDDSRKVRDTPDRDRTLRAVLLSLAAPSKRREFRRMVKRIIQKAGSKEAALAQYDWPALAAVYGVTATEIDQAFSESAPGSTRRS